METSRTVNSQLPQGCYVMLHVGKGPSSSETYPSPIIVADGRQRFELNDDIWIERFDKELAQQIQTACEPAHYNIKNVPYDRHLYALVRRVPRLEKSRYEGIGTGIAELFAVAAFSRLIHPTSIGSRYCALIFDFGLQNSPILAVQATGMSDDVFLDQNNQRDWLSVADGELLRKLMPWASINKRMNDRIHRAYWNHEYAMRSYYKDVRWTLVVSGFEALINTDMDDPKRQFRLRVAQLASELQINLTDDELDRAYDMRSKLVQAQSFLVGLGSVLPRIEHNALYGKLESLLRMVIQRCLLDNGFAARFENAAAVKARWPLRPRLKRKSLVP